MGTVQHIDVGPELTKAEWEGAGIHTVAGTFSPAAHKDNHKTAGGDAFLVSDFLDAISRVSVRKNTGGANVGARRRLNLIEGANIVLTIADDAAAEEVDITIEGTATGLGGCYITVAAANTPAVLKARADYVCTGTSALGGDEITINTALAAADIVVLMPGAYWVNNVVAQTYAVLLASGQTLKGCGPSTVIKIHDAHDDTLFMFRNSDIAAGNNRINILNLKADGNRVTQGAGSMYGIQMTKVGVDSTKLGVRIECCWVENFRTYGIGLTECYNSMILGNFIRYVSRGIVMNTSCDNMIMSNHCSACSNDGIHLETAVTKRNQVIGNHCHSNGTYGLYITGSLNNILGNHCYLNQQSGMRLDHADDNLVEGNICTENSQEMSSYYNIELADSDRNLIQGNTCRKGALANKPIYGIAIASSACDKNIVRSNDLRDAGNTANLYDAGTCTKVKDNEGTTPDQDKDYIYAKNTSGGALAAGDVVILKAVAAGNEVTTTVTGGDKKVYGMAAEIIANTAWGLVQVMGKTVLLKVDGTADIAIGDFLSTFTTAKIAKKASAGDMAFAIALEAYATDNSLGVIDALLISPRMV